MPPRRCATGSVETEAAGRTPGSQHRHDAAVDVDDLAADVVGGRRGEEHHGSHHVLRLAPAPRRRAPLHPAVELGIVHQRRVHLGGDVAGSDGVDGDALRRPFRRHRPGQHLDTALRRRVGGDGGPRQFAGQRTDVDDLAVAARHHPPRRLASDDEGRGEVHLDHPAPVGGLELEDRLAELDAGVVDQDVDRDAGRVERGEGGLDRRLVGDVEGRLVDGVALRPEIAGGRGDARRRAAVDHHRGAGFGQAFGEAAAEAAGRSGDERGAAGEVEGSSDHLAHPRSSERRTRRSVRS